MRNDFVNRVAAVFGVDPKTRSTYRSPEEQQDLYDRGKTPLKGGQSAHNVRDGAIDLPPFIAKTEAEAQAKLRAAGINDAVIKYESGKGKNQGTGRHWHAQQLPEKRVVMANTTPKVNPAQVDLKTVGIEALLGGVEGALTGTTNDSPLLNPYEAEGRMRTQAATVGAALDKQDEFFKEFEARMPEIQRTRRENQEETIAKKTLINDVLQAETQALTEKVMPVMKQRTEAAERIIALTEVGGLEKDIRGIFDKNYDEGYWTRKADKLDKALSIMGQDYQYVTSLREKLFNQLTTEEGLDEQQTNLDLLEYDEDGKIIAMGIQNANQQFQFTGQVVSQNENLIRAQQLTTDKYLTELDLPSLIKLEQEAEKTGVAVVDGIEIPLGEVRTRRINWESQDLAFKSQQLAHQANQISLADAQASRWAEYATESQLRAADANGGVYNGMKIPQAAITNGLINFQQRRELKANQVAQGNPLATLGRAQRETGDYISRLGVGSASLFGGKVPPELRAAADELVAKSKAIDAMIRTAAKNGTTTEVAAIGLAQFQEMRAALDARVEEIALRNAGGDKVGAGLMTSFMRGERIDGVTGANAMVHFLKRGGLPGALRSSPAARRAFEAAKGAQERVDAKYGGQKVSASIRDAAIAEEIVKSVPDAYHGESFNQLISALPALARKNGEPFGSVRDQDFQDALRTGTESGWTSIAATLGISADAAKALFAGSYKGNDKQALQLRIKNENLRAQLKAQQMAATADALDNSPSARPGFKPSEALVAMMEKPQFSQWASRAESLATGSSFGDFIAGSISNGILVERANSWSQKFSDQVTQNRISEVGLTERAKGQYNTDPLYRASIILRAIPDIEQPEEDALLSAIAPAIESTGGSYMDNETRRTVVITALRNAKFKDPGLERVRRVAVQNWENSSAQVDRAIKAVQTRPVGNPRFAHPDNLPKAF